MVAIMSATDLLVLTNVVNVKLEHVCKIFQAINIRIIRSLVKVRTIIVRRAVTTLAEGLQEGFSISNMTTLLVKSLVAQNRRPLLKTAGNQANSWCIKNLRFFLVQVKNRRNTAGNLWRFLLVQSLKNRRINSARTLRNLRYCA